MLAYAFTDAHGRAYCDGAVWGAPGGSGHGPWTAAPAVSPLRGRVRGHEIADLPYALDEALWVVELDGDVRREPRLTSADRGRLVRRVDAWDGACAADFSRACQERASAVALPGGGPAGALIGGYREDLGRCVDGPAPGAVAAGAAGYIGAVIAAIAAGPERRAAGAASERAAQARWLAGRLGLEDPPAA